MSNPELFGEVRGEVTEGPVWDPRDGSCYVVDVTGGDLHRLRDDGSETFALGEMIGCAVLTGDPDVMLVALQSGVCRYRLSTKEKTPVAGTSVNADGIRFNDGKVDPHGRFWVGSMEVKPLDSLGVLYRMDAEGLTPLKDGFGISNGLAWHSDGKRMYHIDSKCKQIAEYAFDVTTGEVGDTVRVVDTSAFEGVPDGMCIDAEDCLWVAFWGGSCVRRFDPASGNWSNQMDFPASQVSSCAFCGPELDTLLVTTASIGKADSEPLAGRVFKVSAPVRGCESTFWKEDA